MEHPDLPGKVDRAEQVELVSLFIQFLAQFVINSLPHSNLLIIFFLQEDSLDKMDRTVRMEPLVDRLPAIMEMAALEEALVAMAASEEGAVAAEVVVAAVEAAVEV